MDHGLPKSVWGSLACVVVCATAFCEAPGTASLSKDAETWVLENRYLRATVSPPSGGALASVRGALTNRELLAAPSFVDSNYLVGCRVQGLDKLAMEAVSPKEGAGEEATVAVSAMLPPDLPLEGEHLVGRAWDPIVWHPKEALKKHPFESLRLTKTFRLHARSPVLAVDYELANTGKEDVAICLGTSVSPSGVRLCVPTLEGGIAVDLPFSAPDARALLRLDGGGRTWLYDTPGAWAGNVDPEGKGLVIAFEPRHVSFLAVAAARPTVSVARTRVTVPAGGRFQTRAWAMPVDRLRRIHGVSAEMAASFRIAPAAADGAASIFRRTYTDEMLKTVKFEEGDLGKGQPAAGGDKEQDATDQDFEDSLVAEERKGKTGYQGASIRVALDITSGKDREIEVVWEEQMAGRPERRPLGSGKCALQAGRNATLETSLKPKEEGTYVVHADLREGGKALAHFEHPVIAGRPKRFYVTEAPPKEGDVNPDFLYYHCGRPDQPMRWDWSPTMDVPSYHTKIARSLAGGPFRLLAVIPYRRAREVVELAQRLDIDCDTVPQLAWAEGGDARTIVAPDSEVDRLRRGLNKPHDAIVLGTFLGQKFPLDVMEEILRQVKEEGVGLIVSVAANLVGPLADYSKQAQKDEGLFPDCPARVVQAGKGRIAFFDGEDAEFRTYWISQNGRASEHDFGNFVKVMQWTSSRRPPVTIQVSGLTRTVEREKLPSSATMVTLKNQGTEDMRGTLHLAFHRDLVAECPYYDMIEMERRQYPSWELWTEDSKPVVVKAGETTKITIPPPSLPSGFLVLQAALRDEQGRTVNWTRVPVTVTSGSYVSAVTVTDSLKRTTEATFERLPAQDHQKAMAERDKRFFTADQGDQIAVTCVCKGKGEMDRVEVLATDPWNRLVARQESPLTQEPEQASASFRIPIASAYHRVLELKVRLHDRSGCIQERRLLGFIQPRLERIPAFGWITYSPDSDLRPDVTGYDCRHRGFVAIDDIIRHAWCNMNMAGLFNVFPAADDILLPGDEELPQPTAPAAKDLEVTKEEEPDAETELHGKKIDYKKGYIRVPCLMNPKWRQAAIQDRENYFRTRGTYCRPFNATMEDEFYYTKETVDTKVPNGFRRQFILCRDGNICRCEYCLAAFRTFTSKLYGEDLDALNREWSSKYRSWKDVDPPILSTNRTKVSKNFKYVDPSTSDSSQEEKCPPEEVWPHVIDHRRFIDHQIADILIEIRAAARRGAPTSKLGWGDLMGDTSIWNGLDAFLLAPHMDFNGLDHEINIWQSLGHPDNSHFVGYAKQYSMIRESTVPWSMMFDGNTNIGNWNNYDYPKHREDFTFYDGPLVVFRTMREIRENGYDRLLVGHRYNDPVAILYDTRSIYVSELQEWKEDQETFFRNMAIGSRSHNDTCKKVEQTYVGLLARHYLQYFTVGYGHLDEGHFGKFGTPKMLFLPYTQCISQKQAETLERFVREGGTLVGDVHTGFRDEHGLRLPEGRLNALFGIRQTRRDGMRVRRDAQGKEIPVRFGPECGGPYALGFEAAGPGDVTATSAKAYARFTIHGQEQPAFLVNELGKGKAIYLNFLPSGYHEIVGDITEGDEAAGKDTHGATVGEKKAEGIQRDRLQMLFETILKIAGVAAPVESNGGVSIFRFGEGEVEYLGLDAGYKFPPRWRQPYEIRIPRKRHVYDVRAGAYIGFTDRIDARFDEDTLKMNLLYALLPYKLDAVQIRLDAGELVRGGTLAYTATVDPEQARPYRQVLSARVLDPQGKDLRWYGTCIETRNGAAQGRVDLALSDPPGTYTLRLRDAATGTNAETKFVVKP